MLISLITPTFNSSKTIERNVRSVITQSVGSFEHIIVDNLSNDGTPEIVRRLYKDAGLEEKLKIMQEKDNGISDAFNKGIRSSRGDIIGILNSDDHYFNNTVFEKVLRAFEDPEVLYVHGSIYFVDPVYGSNVRKPLLCDITTTMPFNHPTMFFRKSVYEDYGIYDTSYKYAMDYELIVRYEKLIRNFREKGKYLTGEPIATMYAGGASWDNELKSIEETKRALKAHGFWNIAARKNNFLRMFRTKLKTVLNFLNMNRTVKYWRDLKWKD